jgi:hypothetical protein
MLKIILLAFFLSTAALAETDECRQNIGIQAALMLAKVLKVSPDVALREWRGYEPGKAELIQELDDKEIYEVFIDTRPVIYRMDIMRQSECNLSLVWLEKELRSN